MPFLEWRGEREKEMEEGWESPATERLKWEGL